MQTRSDIEAETVQRVMAAANSTLFNADRITGVVKDSYLWAGSLFFWPSLQKARVTTALKNTQLLTYDYYDYPPDFLTDSISRLYIDGKKYEHKAYQDFLDYVDSSNNTLVAPNPNNHFFANFGRQYFVYPSYTGVAPANNLLIWGNIQPPALVNPSDTTIFSQWDDAGNEAVVKKSFATLMVRIEPSLSGAAEKDAIGLLQVMWKKIADQNQRAQRLNHPFFNVPDFFGSGSGQSTQGNFNIPVDIENTF